MNTLSTSKLRTISIIAFFLITIISQRAFAIVYSGSLPVPSDNNVEFTITGSFGVKQLYARGGLDLIIDLSQTTLVYEEIVFQTQPQQEILTGNFTKGLGGEIIPITLSLTYQISCRLKNPSPGLKLFANSGGLYSIEGFSYDSKNTDFSMTVTWNATGPTESTTGSMSVPYYSVSCNTQSDIDASGYPNSIALVNFGWDGYCPINASPIETTVDGVPLYVGIDTFVGLRGFYAQTLSLAPLSTYTTIPTTSTPSTTTSIRQTTTTVPCSSFTTTTITVTGGEIIRLTNSGYENGYLNDIPTVDSNGNVFWNERIISSNPQYSFNLYYYNGTETKLVDSVSGNSFFGWFSSGMNCNSSDKYYIKQQSCPNKNDNFVSLYLFNGEQSTLIAGYISGYSVCNGYVTWAQILNPCNCNPSEQQSDIFLYKPNNSAPPRDFQLMSVNLDFNRLQGYRTGSRKGKRSGA